MRIFISFSSRDPQTILKYSVPTKFTKSDIKSLNNKVFLFLKRYKTPTSFPHLKPVAYTGFNVFVVFQDLQFNAIANFILLMSKRKQFSWGPINSIKRKICIFYHPICFEKDDKYVLKARSQCCENKIFKNVFIIFYKTKRIYIYKS